MKNLNLVISISIALLLSTFTTSASKLVSASILDKDIIMLYFRDGDAVFNEKSIAGCPVYFQCQAESQLNTYGDALNTANSATASNWKITSTDDPDFADVGVSPTMVFRKSKLGCMAQPDGSNYVWAYEHTLFLRLPKSMKSGKNYTINLPNNINSDVLQKKITFDIFNNKSEAVRVNIVGYSTANSIKSADVYIWMGNGGSRDYSTFVGKKVYIYNTDTGVSTEVGTLALWKNIANEMAASHAMIHSNVWKVDFTGFNTAGHYRLAVEDIGCSDDFTISDNIYYEPFKVSTRGFYYQRVGETNTTIIPRPRLPLYIPGVSPTACKVYVTTITPYDPDWTAVLGQWGDQWDNTWSWASYRKPGNPTNPNAYGGHADACDWDRHLGHVAIIYDMLLPYFVSNGAIANDDLDLPESGNGIPDIIDEAKYEVDFWLRLRDGMGYSHGVNNPDGTNTAVLYQAGTTPIAAWANAANAAMIADCFRISGHNDLMAEYRDSAIVAYNYASSLSNQMLTVSQDVGNGYMTGKDFRITAAAFLYNLTGDTKYENDLNTYSNCKTNSSKIIDINGKYTEIYAVAAYLFTPQEVHYPTLYSNMKSSLISEAKAKEANYSNTRPSRRSTDNDTGWFITSINTDRTIVAHAISEEGSADRALFENALILEADFSLGRNPLNMINMTTASTNLADKKSVPNAFTTGWNDRIEGVAPGITPYMNTGSWGSNIEADPGWMYKNNFPVINDWPEGELYFNTRYVYAANEYTPQQSMRGKTALYGYLYAISPEKQNTGNEKVGISEKDTSLHIYPVPANETIHISNFLDGIPYMIYNIAGVELASGTLSMGTIDISHLAQGIYFIALNNLRGKFIKL